MASISKYKGGFRIQICVCGVRDSKVFRTKAEAKTWAALRETEIRADKESKPAVKFTLNDALERYAAEVSPKKRGELWEIKRINAMRTDAFSHKLPLALPIGRITTSHLSEWRDHRQSLVSDGTVLREYTILAGMFEIARREWQWIDTNPARDVRRPQKPDHRERVISLGEIRQMLRALDWRSTDSACKSAKQAAGRVFMLALRTGMRAGEICGLTWDRIKDDYCILPVTKTKPRNVPLTAQSLRLIASMQGWDRDTVFGIKPQTLDALFRKARAASGLSGFTFHDSRHTAATMLARKIDVLDLCKMFGWTNPSQAMVYYNPTASDIAKRLGKP